MIDYSLFKMHTLKLGNLASFRSWDVFASAFNASERVQRVFEAVSAGSKHWLIHPEYDSQETELPKTDKVFQPKARDEADWWASYFGWASLSPSESLCLDITGLMRPHLMLLPKLLAMPGYKRVSLLYSDPVSYSSGAKTPFAKGAVSEVRQVRGLEGLHSPHLSLGDLLVIGAGYDDELIRRVAEHKPAARKFQLFGLPSLQAHMYQESHLRAYRAAEAVGPLSDRSLLFAPANNPFVTASVLQSAVGRESAVTANIYLCPLGTKPQALGLALYFLMEQDGGPASMLFPIAPFYSQETSVGLSRISVFELELDELRSWSC